MIAGEKPPLEPVAALAHTQDGAIAFAKFWIQTLDWGYATTSTAYARHYVGPSCSICSTALNAIDKDSAAGYHFVGGRINVTSAKSSQAPLTNGAEAAVLVLANVAGLELVDANGSFVKGAAAIPGRPFTVELNWNSTQWQVADFGGA